MSALGRTETLALIGQEWMLNMVLRPLSLFYLEPD